MRSGRFIPVGQSSGRHCEATPVELIGLPLGAVDQFVDVDAVYARPDPGSQRGPRIELGPDLKMERFERDQVAQRR